jgi:hypothetical protein
MSNPKPPSMLRSRTQIATSYAPGSLFTFEGNLGACRSYPVRTEEANLSIATRLQILELLDEYAKQWAMRGKAIDGTPIYSHSILMQQVVDASLIAPGDEVRVSEDRFAFLESKQMGYEPFPLSFICRECGLHRSCKNLNGAEKSIENFGADCPKKGGKCADDWEQLDVIMAHWSGSVEPLTPVKRSWSNDLDRITESDSCKSCGHKAFILKRPGTFFSDWYFECAKCKIKREILLGDKHTLTHLGRLLPTGQSARIEMNMEPVSYRASAVHYVQSDKLLDFKEFKYFELLRQNKTEELLQFLAQKYGYPGKLLTDAERERILRDKGLGAEWDTYQMSKASLEALRDKAPEAILKPLLDQQKEKEERWSKTIFTDQQQVSAALRAKVGVRSEFIRKFDPIRMAVEHETLLVEKINKGGLEDGKKPAVDVTDPDQHLIPAEMTDPEKDEVRVEVSQRLKLLGIEKMYLIRNLGICEYSFGYSRTSPNPWVKRDKGFGEVELPVRLNLFERIGMANDGARHPIYCIQQKNEAFYVRLDPEVVLKWIEANGFDFPSPMPSSHPGGALIESFPAADFTRFLDGFRKEGGIQPTAYAYVYALLHTMAHQLIEICSELSGLDLGSLSEHIFVPELAFLVYRRGTTMDLGNLSSMWRDHAQVGIGNAVLQRMVMPDSLRCGSETVCMMRGGACPDCILIPETSCITRNELLSRSVLTGSGHPKWDATGKKLAQGFYKTARLGMPSGLSF